MYNTREFILWCSLLMLRLFSLVALIITTTFCQAGDIPNIMVSIKPFYNITAAVMQDVGTPQLLIKGNSSPHDYHLRPSDAKLISNSDLIIWGGVGLEPYLQKPIYSLGNSNLDLSQATGLELLPLREDQNWQHSHDHSHAHDHSHNHADYDPHFWLNPENAITLATAIAEELSTLDPDHAALYQANAKELAKKIRSQELVWKNKLKPYTDSPYIVGHDAFQYFNNYFYLDGVGAITLNPELPPSAKHIQELQELLISTNVTCIFNEPQFSNKIIDTLIEGTNVNIGILDPLGQDQDMGADGYVVLINNIVSDFVECNKNNSPQ